MEIVQNKTKLTVISNEIPNYSYVYIIEKVTTANKSIAFQSVSAATSDFTITTDAYYIITSLKITTVAGSGYYINGSLVYNIANQIVSMQELLNIQNYTITNIVEEHADYIFTYYTNTYYINLLQTKYLKGLCACNCTNSQEKLTVDSLNMGFVLLDQLSKNKQYLEVERLIEKLTMCTGIINLDCGCHE